MNRAAIAANRISRFSAGSIVVLTLLVIWLGYKQNEMSLQAVEIANETKAIETSPVLGFTIINVGRAPAFVNGFTSYLNGSAFIRVDSFTVRM